jgi:hypothetical protein
VWPWKHFKEVIADLCQSRINSSPEIIGAVRPYLDLDEYLCLYFLKKHNLRRLAELKLVEFLASLKHYHKLWPRAKLLGRILGITCNVYDNEDYLY